MYFQWIIVIKEYIINTLMLLIFYSYVHRRNINEFITT